MDALQQESTHSLYLVQLIPAKKPITSEFVTDANANTQHCKQA